MSSRWKSRSSFTSGLLARSTDAHPLKAPSPTVPVRPLIITTDPLSRTSARPDSGACSRSGASSVSSTGTFCRSSGGAGAVALMSNLSGCSLARALPVIRILRSAPTVASALRPSTRFSTRSRRLENTIVASLTLMRSIAGAFELVSCAAVAGLDEAGAGAVRRWRSSGTLRTGRTIASSVISGWPDHRLASVMSAWMRPTVRRLVVSRLSGLSSVTSVSVTLSDGHRPTLVEPAIVSRYPVSRSTRCAMAELKKPEGIPMTSSRAATTMMAAIAPPAIFKALMTNFLANFQAGQFGWTGPASGVAFLQAYPGKGEPLKAAKT